MSRGFELIKADLEKAQIDMLRDLNEDLLTSAVSVPHAVVDPPSFWRRSVSHARVYLFTVWRALRGDDLDTPMDWDED